MPTNFDCSLACCLLMSVGCSLFISKESSYLRTATNEATQEQVRFNLGEPKVIKTTQSGDPVWVYEVRDLEPNSQSSWSAFGSWCDEYTLLFDQAGVLRDWTHESYAHGGELMPIACNSSIGVQKPAL